MRFWFLMAVLLCSVDLSNAQLQRIPRIGVLVNGTSASGKSTIDVFREGLHDLGYIEGKNVSIDYRYGEGNLEKLPELAHDLVQSKVDVIWSQATPGTVAAKKATNSIPIVFTGVGDPVASGLVKSFAKPGGNVTGVSILSPELGGKRLELLKEIVPGVNQIAVLWSSSASTTAALKSIQAAADRGHVQLYSLEVRNPSEFTSVSEIITQKRAEAIITNPSPVLGTIRERVVDFAAKNRLPAIYPNSQFVDSGGLMSYAHNEIDHYRRAAVYVDKILKGAKPADLPVELPKKLELRINMKTAKQIGLTIPPNVLARADRVIR